jgi:hypothetical protein
MKFPSWYPKLRPLGELRIFWGVVCVTGLKASKNLTKADSAAIAPAMSPLKCLH